MGPRTASRRGIRRPGNRQQRIGVVPASDSYTSAKQGKIDSHCMP
jgi:hypothetical protein